MVMVDIVYWWWRPIAEPVAEASWLGPKVGGHLWTKGGRRHLVM